MFEILKKKNSITNTNGVCDKMKIGKTQREKQCNQNVMFNVWNK